MRALDSDAAILTTNHSSFTQKYASEEVRKNDCTARNNVVTARFKHCTCRSFGYDIHLQLYYFEQEIPSFSSV